MSSRSISFAIMAGILLTACATGERRAGVQLKDLVEDSSRFVTERTLSGITFPTLQRGLYVHRAACGSAPRFVMMEGETGRALLVDSDEIPESYENVVVGVLTQYPESFRASERVIMQVYSYYDNDEAKESVQRMLAAVYKPGDCQASAK